MGEAIGFAYDVSHKVGFALAYRMILKKQWDYADISRLDANWRVKYLLPSSYIGLIPLRRAKLLCGAKPAVGQRASFGVR
jgi:hypothetical protein